MAMAVDILILLISREVLYMNEEQYYEESGFWWGVLAFIFPFIGIILATAWFSKRPNRAHGCIVGILVGMSISILLAFIWTGVLIKVVINSPYPGTNPSYPGTGPNWNNPGNYEPPHNEFHYPSPPNPYEAIYENSSDGVLKFVLTREDLPTVYDAATNSVIVWDNFTNCIYVYDAASGEEIFTKKYSKTIACVAAYGGNLAVAFKNDYVIDVVDLTTFSIKQISTGNYHYIYSMQLTDDAIICAGNEFDSSSNYIFKLKLSNGEFSHILSLIHDPTFAVNHEDNYLYVAERNLSSCDLYYVNLYTNESQQKTEFMQYSYSSYELFYDDEYVHAFGNLYDTLRGKIVYQGQSIIQNIGGVDPYATLCIDGKYSLTTTTDCKTVVYDSKSKAVVYAMNLYATRIYSLGSNQYLALCGDSGYYALIDLSKVI